MESNDIRFDAIRGVQAKKEFYVAMCTLKSVAKLFTFQDPDIPVDARAQRTLRKARIPRIRDYILDNPEDYIFSSLTVSVGSKITFQSMVGQSKDGNLGTISMPQDASMLINDGQHRVTAIKEAIEHMPELGAETISVVFFEDKGLEKSQQMFSDLNKNAVKPTKSLGLLYDTRNTFSKFVVSMIKNVTIFNGRIDYEKTTISNRSRYMFTLNGVAQSTKILLKNTKNLTKENKDFVIEYWNEVARNIPDWNLLINKKVTPFELRESYVHASTNMLRALATAGNVLVDEFPDSWQRKLVGLNKIDWGRENPKWDKNIVLNGKMVRTKDGARLAADVILKACGSSRRATL